MRRFQFLLRFALGAAALTGVVFALLAAEEVRAEPLAERGAERGQALVTYSGLRVYKDGSSTFQVKLTAETPVAFSQQGMSLTFLLKGARVDVKNNKNPLQAEYFKSNVVKTQLYDGKEGVELRINLRKAATPVHKMVRFSGGAILRVDIPPPA